ncbi:hypothetical protein AUJ42_01425 [Candidatus Collierbacteria bacterium CG1_02_44_10]|uniref:Uncharacterized protein n=1 Tax=Candidatus Collierbacteria bacterium CG1_02_44_10 TaxID=1805087 RepID=A0A1J4RYZ4_9BACT|nr:MAG: hypothetical protein AUJ42_01425 [Candidatus Collierbacteria bacterium CG1_02_44_10]
MLGMISTSATVFADSKLLWSVGLVAFGNIVEVTAFSAFKTHVLSWTFFCHVVLIILIFRMVPHVPAKGD